MYEVGDVVTVTKATSAQRGHVGVVVCTHERGYLRVWNATIQKPRRWAERDVKAGGDLPEPTPPAPPEPTPTPTPPEPAAPVSSLALGLDIPGDWPERVVPSLATFGPAWVRIDASRVPRAGWPATFGPIRRSGARVIAMVPRSMSSAASVSFAKQWLLPDDVLEGENETGYVDRTQAFAAGQAYGVRMRGLRDAMDAAGLRLGLIVQADPAARGTGFIDGLYASWPDVHRRVAGFVLHPYGPPTQTELMDGFRNRLAEQHRQLVAHGAPADVPIWVTEWGLSTNNGMTVTMHDSKTGRDVPNNYGWPANMTSEQAAVALEATVEEFDERPENIVVAVLFQAVNQGEIGDARTNRELWFGLLDRLGKAKGVLTTTAAALFRRFRG